MLGARSQFASAPGRVTVLGEHTDYNEGCSLGIATPWRTSATAAPTDDGTVEVVSAGYATASSPIDEPSGPAHVVVAASLARAAGVSGARLDVTSDLPAGAGLASSASFAVAVALALGLRGSHLEVARACQEAELAAGSDVGLLDQLVILHARQGHVVDVDFTAPAASTFALHEQIGLSIVDTGVRRLVAASDYASRRAECAAASAVIGALGHATLRDVEWLSDTTVRRRARHVVTECGRVREARAVLRAADVDALGALLDEAHRSLRDDFEASTAEVEAVRDEVRRVEGVTGVRLTGAGFGGCLVVAHRPDVEVLVPGRWCVRLVPGGGAILSASR